jgi:hypothetical protein
VHFLPAPLSLDSTPFIYLRLVHWGWVNYDTLDVDDSGVFASLAMVQRD